jgi:hypothetical protein
LERELAVAKESLLQIATADREGGGGGTAARLTEALAAIETHCQNEALLVAAAFEATQIAETYHMDYINLATSLGHHSAAVFGAA